LLVEVSVDLPAFITKDFDGKLIRISGSKKRNQELLYVRQYFSCLSSKIEPATLIFETTSQ
jgi:hypothetical protein